MKVLTYNVREDCRNGFERVADVIRTADADAIALMELASRDTAEWLAAELEMKAVFGEGNCDWHVAWLTRLPVRGSVNHRDPRFAKTLLEIEVEWGRLFATHLASRHETWTHSWEEVPVILDLLRSTSGPHVLLGDLNAFARGDRVGTPPPDVVPRPEVLDGPARHALEPLGAAGYVDCYRRFHANEPGYTYAADHPWLRIDYIFASPRAGELVQDCDLIDDKRSRLASDHLPLWATFGDAAGR